MGYDFQAAGEFTALRSKSGDMVFQVRQVPWRDSRWVSVNSAIAVKVNGDRLMIEYSNSQKSLIVRINGESIAATERRELPAGGFIMRDEHGAYLIGWPDGSLLRARQNVRDIDASLYLVPERAGTVLGLLGPFTGQHGEILQTKDSKTVTANDIKNYHHLYRVFGDSWRISQAESLFDYAPGTSTATYQIRDFPHPNPPKLASSVEASARATCVRAGVPERALAGCILDVAMTGEAGFAAATALAMRPPDFNPAARTAQSFSIKIGDQVAPDKPGKGAGRIEMAGARDSYTFTAAAGTLVYLKADPGCTSKNLRWGLQDPEGRLFLSLADIYPVCDSLERVLLKTAGTYTIVVKGNQEAIGDYGFTLLPVAADQSFAIKIGDQVAPDKPGKGAGRIEMAGARDHYTFTAAADTHLYLKAEPPCSNKQLHWGVRDAQENWVTSLNDLYSICEDIGRLRLQAGGTYTIVVRADKEATGDYSFTVQPERK